MINKDVAEMSEALDELYKADTEQKLYNHSLEMSRFLASVHRVIDKNMLDSAPKPHNPVKEIKELDRESKT